MSQSTRVYVDYIGDDFQTQHESGLQTAIRVLTELSTIPDRLILDFSDLDWTPAPFLVPIACIINQYQDIGTTFEVDYPSEQVASTYLDAVRFPYGISGEPARDSTYLPIFRLDPTGETDELDVAANRIRELIRGAITNPAGNIVDSIFLPVSEAIDNVDLHSRFDEAAVMAQLYENRRFVDICITDDGIGIPGSYDRHGIDYSDDEDAITMAVEEGVSTRENTLDDMYSGTGLRNTRRLVCEGLGGEFMIASNECAIAYEQDEKRVMYSASWDGTSLAARLLPPDEDFSFYDYLG